MYNTVPNSVHELLSDLGKVFFVFVALDLLILVFALMQIALEGQTGYWSPFWLNQLRFIAGLFGV